MSPAVSGSAFANPNVVPGGTATGRWTQSDGRAALTGSAATQGGNRTLLEQSGATGGGGLHS